MRRSVYRAVGIATWSLILPGCFGLMDKATPEPQTASDATGRVVECDAEGALPARLRPLVVDMDAMDRVDLEVSMRDGLVVVRHDCNGMEILRDCRVESDYGFIGVQRKEEVVRLDSTDEIGANLPLSAGTLGAKLGADFNAESTLDIAMVMVGKKRSTKATVGRTELLSVRPGACDHATHYVRGATIGAFAMTTGVKSEARAAAEIFGIPNTGTIGVGGGSKRSKDVSKKDGDVASCNASTPDSADPPSQCGALLHLELALITEDGVEAGGGGDPIDEICPPGYVLAEGKCTDDKAGPHLCKPKDYADCEKQCDAGNAPSCGRVAYYTLVGEHFERDAAKAVKLFDQACQDGYTVACASLGGLYVEGEVVERDVDEGVALLEKACDDGDARFCSFLAQMSYVGNGVPKDMNRAAKYASRGCFGGSAGGCFVLGQTYLKGVGGNAKDPVKARSLYLKGCRGKDALACYAYAVALQEGTGGPKDDAKARTLFTELCTAGMREACKEK